MLGESNLELEVIVSAAMVLLVQAIYGAVHKFDEYESGVMECWWSAFLHTETGLTS